MTTCILYSLLLALSLTGCTVADALLGPLFDRADGPPETGSMVIRLPCHDEYGHTFPCELAKPPVPDAESRADSTLH